MELETLEYEERDHVAIVTLNRPERHNAFNEVMQRELRDVWQAIKVNDDVRAVVLTGSGRAFCVGQDLREHIENIASKPLEEVWATVDAHYSPIALGLATMAKPVIAAVNGVAAGAGLSIAMACDLRIAADTAGFNTAFTGVALSCDTGSSWTLPRLIGPTKAMELLLMPRTLDSQEALELGLVNRVVPHDELLPHCRELAARIAAGPSVAIEFIKKIALRTFEGDSFESVTAYEAFAQSVCEASEDGAEGVRSFQEKREPRFQGR